MRTRIAYALLLDALYQVLDDKVFRFLAIVVGVAILAPVLVAFREEEIVILFGMNSYSYKEAFSAIGAFFDYPPEVLDALSDSELREMIVDEYQNVIATGLFGTVGILLCLAATSFFVPRMIEKGTADTVFSKPVSRLSLLLSRYAAGILFVAILGGSLVVGTHVSLLLAGGLSDPAFLLTVPALVYKFALVYAFTVLVGVVARSTVAALILTILFVPLNNTLHTIWNVAQMSIEQQAKLEGDDSEAPAGALAEPGADAPESAPATFVKVLYQTFQFLHYSLPKTNDAIAIAKKLRSSLIAEEAPAFEAPEIDFSLVELPSGFSEVPQGSREPLKLFLPPHEADALVYAAGEGGNANGAGVSILLRRARELPIGTSGRTRLESWRSAASDFEKWIESDPARVLLADETDSIAIGTPWNRSARRLDWTASEAGQVWNMRTLLLEEGDSILVLQLRTPEGWLDAHQDVRSWFGGRNFAFESKPVSFQDPSEWYEAKLDWRAPWRFNILFSLGSSLGFAAVMLALAWWRLSRMDF